MLDWRSKTDTRGVCVSIDPGVRTFATCYDPEGLVCKWGAPAKNDAGNAFWCFMRHICALYASIGAAERGSVKFVRLCAVAAHLEGRINEMIDKMHHRLAIWICQNYDTVLLPEYTPVVQANVTERIICAGHARFRAHLKEIAAKYKVVINECSEAFTTKTCGICGHLSNIRGCDIFECKNPTCAAVFDRDENAARNILIKFIVNRQT
jgi:putative transposase